MRISRTRLAALSCAAVFALVGCSGADGADGADGLAGAAGTDGKDGINGTDGTDGKNGTTGTKGADGTKGTDGADGADGNSVLVTTTDEPEGANCPRGGKRIDTGLDVNDNGVLDPNEKGTPTYVCNGASGNDGASSRIRTITELAGEHCAFGGVAIQTGLDSDDDGLLDDAEVDANATSYVCNTAPAWAELRALPSVGTAYSYALSVSDVDGSARLGFMFKDAAYRTALSSELTLWDGGGVYSGDNVFAVYNLQGFGPQASWKAYQGRYTPQYYAYSELTFDNGSSYYTTNYASFGGLVSVVKDAMQGTYALTPAYSPGRAHSVAFVNHTLYALIAQKNVGLTLSTFPVASFGNLSNIWVNLATIVPAATSISAPKLINAAGTLVGAYLSGGNASIRATKTPGTVSAAADFVEIGSCTGAVRVDVAWADGKLYAGCIDGAGTLTLQKADIASLDAVTWEPVTTGITGAVNEIDLSGLGTRLALAVRQGPAVRAYASPADAKPSFDAVIPGSFDLQVAKEGLVLSVCELNGNKTVRTFWH